MIVAILSPTLLIIDWDGRFLLPILPLVFLIGSGSKALGSSYTFGYSLLIVNRIIRS
jgi:hypothetical protein